MEGSPDPTFQQLSSLYRQGMCFPLDDATEDMFRRWCTCSRANARLLRLEPHDFGHLRSSGMLEAINVACGSLIDEYEEAILEPGQISVAIGVLDDRIKRGWPEPTLTLWVKMRELLAEARVAERPVYFVL